MCKCLFSEFLSRFRFFSSPVNISHSPGRKDRVSSLQSLVCWYQEHSRSCPHEPQLKALEPQLNFSTAAIWQCDSDHSFVQYLFSPPREASDSEHEEGANGEENAAKSDPLVSKGAVSRRRRKETHKPFRGGYYVNKNICGLILNSMIINLFSFHPFVCRCGRK